MINYSWKHEKHEQHSTGWSVTLYRLTCKNVNGARISCFLMKFEDFIIYIYAHTYTWVRIHSHTYTLSPALTPTPTPTYEHPSHTHALTHPSHTHAHLPTHAHTHTCNHSHYIYFHDGFEFADNSIYRNVKYFNFAISVIEYKNNWIEKRTKYILMTRLAELILSFN